MKKNIGFCLILFFSILFVALCFKYANSVRGTNTMGSEIFTITLPLLIVANKLDEMEEKIKKLKTVNKMLQKHIS